MDSGKKYISSALNPAKKDNDITPPTYNDNAIGNINGKINGIFLLFLTDRENQALANCFN